jgi:hypothetical protein
LTLVRTSGGQRNTETFSGISEEGDSALACASSEKMKNRRLMMMQEMLKSSLHIDFV